MNEVEGVMKERNVLNGSEWNSEKAIGKSPSRETEVAITMPSRLNTGQEDEKVKFIEI